MTIYVLDTIILLKDSINVHTLDHWYNLNFQRKKDVSSGYVKVILDDGVNIDYQMFYDAPSFYKKDIMGLDDINLVLDRQIRDILLKLQAIIKN